MAYKVLGLSFGSRNGTCDASVKEALIGARAAGAEISFINATFMKIERCVGCGGCNKRAENFGPQRCTIKDDFPFLEDQYLEADAIIVAAPVYSLAPPGQFKNFSDRMGASHDRAAMIRENERRIALGKSEDELLDPRLFKRRVAALISVGGAATENWTSLGLPNMHCFAFSTQTNVVDQLNIYRMGRRRHILLDEELTNRLDTMGANMIKALNEPEDSFPWYGEEGVCPVCHCNMLSVKKTTDVECPICGIHGTLRVEGDQVKVDFPKENWYSSRLRLGGLIDHQDECAENKKCGIRLKPQMDAAKELAKEKYKDIPEPNKADFVENMKR